MRQFYGTDISPYGKEERAVIGEATRYEIFVYRIFLLWDITVMSAGVLYVYINSAWLTTNEILGVLGVVWGISGLPFFLLRDLVVRKFAGRLPKPAAQEPLTPPSLPVLLFKAAAGFVIGAWATHVMIIYATTKHFQYMNYAKKLSA